MEQLPYNPDRPVKWTSLQVGMVIWSTIAQGRMTVIRVTDQYALAQYASGNVSPFTRLAVESGNLGFFHIDGEQDYAAQIRAQALQLMDQGRALLALADKLHA